MKTGNITPLFQNLSPKTAFSSKVASGTCPHGMAPGSCAICSGSGGGGGGGVSKKGEMSWNEGYGVWMSILSSKKNIEQRKEFFNQSLLMDQTKNKLEILNTAKFFASVNSMMQSFKSALQPLSNLKEAIASTIKELKTFTANVISKVSQFINDAQTKLTGVLNMISAFLGEQQKILKEFLNKGLENLKKLSFLKNAVVNFGQFVTHKAAQITKHVFEKLNKAKQVFNDLFKKMKTKEKVKLKNKQKEPLDADPVEN
jgi:hypothetical protein